MPRKMVGDVDPVVATETALARQTRTFRQALATIANAETFDPAAEQTLVDLWRLVARHWEAFEVQQSPLSTWTMLLRATETLLKVRHLAQRTASQAEEREAFKAWLAEIGVAARGAPAVDTPEDEDEEDEDE